MIKIPNMLIIGSTGRNSGKTLLASKLLQNNKNKSIIALKVTSIKQNDGSCPRGGMGCGVCSSLKQDFLITEEIDPFKNKDTSKLLKSGATKVYWLRVMHNSLKKGIEAFLKLIPEKVLIIVESNSLRKVVEPGLFFIMQNKKSETIKPSCKEVFDLKDKLIKFDESSFNLDININDIKIYNKKWSYYEPSGAIILAGGKSSRMKQDKALLKYNGKTLIEIIFNKIKPLFNEILISSNNNKYDFLNAKVIFDKKKEKGPLMGIISCLKESKYDLNFVIACDIPFFEIKFIQKMHIQAFKYDGVVPYTVFNKNKYNEPLFAFYKKSMLDSFNNAINNNNGKITKAFINKNIKFLKLSKTQKLYNINSFEEYTKLKKVKC